MSAPHKPLLASLPRLVVLLVLPATQRLARTAALGFLIRSKPHSPFFKDSSYPMLIARSVADLRQALAPYRRPAFVPTMGNLHEGHIALVRQAKPLGDVTVASIFVNRLQFLPH